MRPATDSAPVLLFQVWHLMLAGFGLLLVAAFPLGVLPVQAALAGLLAVAVVALVGSRRAGASSSGR